MSVTILFIVIDYYTTAIKILQLGQYIFLTNLTNILWRDIAMRELDFEKIGKKIKEVEINILKIDRQLKELFSDVVNRSSFYNLKTLPNLRVL